MVSVGYIGRIDAGLTPYAVLSDRIRHAGVTNGIVRKFELNVAAYGLVMPGLIFGLNDYEFLNVEHSVGGVFVSGHNRRTVVAGIFTYEECSAWHIFVLFSRTT